MSCVVATAFLVAVREKTHASRESAKKSALAGKRRPADARSAFSKPLDLSPPSYAPKSIQQTQPIHDTTAPTHTHLDLALCPHFVTEAGRRGGGSLVSLFWAKPLSLFRLVVGSVAHSAGFFRATLGAHAAPCARYGGAGPLARA